MPRKSPERVVVVTGASNGPGRAIALEFAMHGEALVLGSRRSGPLDAVRRCCDALHAGTLALVTNLSDEQEGYALANAALARFKRVNIWINYAPPVPLLRGDATPRDAFSDSAVFDLRGYEHGAAAALACFQALGGGVLVNVDSLIGGAPPGCEARYEELREKVAHTFAGIEARARGVPGVRVISVQPSRTPVASEALAPAVASLARAWSRGGAIARILGGVHRARLTVRTHIPGRMRPGTRHDLVPAGLAPAVNDASHASGGVPTPRTFRTAPRRSRGHGRWHLASVVRPREYLSTALLVVVVPLVAVAAALMLIG